MTIDKRTAGLLLALIMLVHLGANLAWHSQNEFPQGRDTFEHLNKAVNVLRLWNNDPQPYFYNPTRTRWHNIIFLSNHYPSLYYWCSALFYKLFYGLFGYKAIYTGSTLLFLLLILISYKIGRYQHNRIAGLFCAFTISLTPILYFSSRQFNLEMAAAVSFLSVLYLVLKSSSLSRKSYAAAGGVMAGISLLFKYTTLMFLAGLLLDLLILNRKHRPRPLDLALFLLPMTLISGIYYSNPKVINFLTWCGSYPGFAGKSLYRFSCYLSGMAFDAFGITVTMLFLLILGISLKTRPLKGVFVFLVPLLTVILIPKRPPVAEIEFLLPMVPLLVISLILRLVTLRNQAVRQTLTTSLGLILVFQFLLTSSYPAYSFYSPVSNFPLSVFGYSKPPIQTSACKDVFKRIEATGTGPVNIGCISHPDSMDIFPAIFQSYVYLNQRPWKFIDYARDGNVFFKHLPNCGYLVYPTDSATAFPGKDPRLNQGLDKLQPEGIYNFTSSNRGSDFQEPVLLYRLSP